MIMTLVKALDCLATGMLTGALIGTVRAIIIINKNS